MYVDGLLHPIVLVKTQSESLISLTWDGSSD